MYYIFVLLSVFSLSVAAVIPDESKAQVLKYENSNDGAGNYRFSYETTNGIYREESGHLVNKGTKDEHMAVEGFYSYTDDTGKYVVFRYTADENGYQVTQPKQVTQDVYRLGANVVATLLG